MYVQVTFVYTPDVCTSNIFISNKSVRKRTVHYVHFSVVAGFAVALYSPSDVYLTLKQCVVGYGKGE